MTRRAVVKREFDGVRDGKVYPEKLKVGAIIVGDLARAAVEELGAAEWEDERKAVPTRADLDKALAELPAGNRDPEYVVRSMRSFFGELFTDADEKFAREVVQKAADEFELQQQAAAEARRIEQERQESAGAEYAGDHSQTAPAENSEAEQAFAAASQETAGSAKSGKAGSRKK